jgi:hypothetical protein
MLGVIAANDDETPALAIQIEKLRHAQPRWSAATVCPVGHVQPRTDEAAQDKGEQAHEHQDEQERQDPGCVLSTRFTEHTYQHCFTVSWRCPPAPFASS